MEIVSLSYERGSYHAMIQSSSDDTTNVESGFKDASASPLRRIFVRYFDIALFGFVFELIIWTLARYDYLEGFNLFYKDNHYMNSTIVFAIASLLIAFTVAIFGTTPGKWLLGIEVVPISNQADSLLKRELLVFVWGSGFGLPVLNFIAHWYQLSKLEGGKSTSYDYGRFDVRQKDVNYKTKIIALISFVLIIYASYLII